MANTDVCKIETVQHTKKLVDSGLSIREACKQAEIDMDGIPQATIRRWWRDYNKSEAIDPTGSKMSHNDSDSLQGSENVSPVEEVVMAPVIPVATEPTTTPTPPVAVPPKPAAKPAAIAQAPAPPKPSPSTFNETNESIDWARWSWNPVTGCKNSCKYCYARDIANRFFKVKFEPTFYPNRLDAPKNTTVPTETNGRDRNVFVCSMADLFGDWVPDEWINKVLDVVRNSPQWNFIFLTKFPHRMININWPSNTKVGTTVDIQSRVAPAEAAFQAIQAPVKFLSCEPMLEELTFQNLSIFDCVIIGGSSKSTQTAEFQPERKWVSRLIFQAEKANVKRVFIKPNLTVYKECP